MATPGNYFQLGLSRVASGQVTLNVIDTDAPASVVLAVVLANGGSYESSQAIAVDAAANTVTYLGSPMVYFVNNGQLFQVPLAKPGTPAAVRISSLTDACYIATAVPVDSTGLDTWLAVETPGADANCSNTADNRRAFVRTGAATTTAATVLPVGVTISRLPLADDQGRLQWMVGIDASTTGAPKAVAYSPTLSRIDVAGGAGVAALGGAANGRLSEGLFVQADRTLRLLTGDASSLTLGPVLHTITSSIGVITAIYDKPKLFVMDGDRVMQLQRGAVTTQVGTLPANGGFHIGIGQTTDHLVAWQRDTLGAETVTAVRKADGSARGLLSSPPGALQQPLGLAQGALYYSAPSAGTRSEIRKMAVATGSDSRVLTDVFNTGPETRNSFSWDFTQVHFQSTAHYYCQAAAQATDCRSGTLSRLDFATEATTVLGSFGGSSVNGTWAAFGGATQGLNNGVLTITGTTTAPITLQRDVQVFNPAQANSLQRVTNLLP